MCDPKALPVRISGCLGEMLGGSEGLAEGWDNLSFYFNIYLNTSLYAQLLEMRHRCVEMKLPQEQIQSHIWNIRTLDLFKAKVTHLGASKKA